MAIIRQFRVGFLTSFTICIAITSFFSALAQTKDESFSSERDRAVSEERKNLQEKELAYTPYSFWLQVGNSGSFYDLTRHIAHAHYSPTLAGGYRFQRWGFYATAGYDILLDFSQEIEQLHVGKVGVGVEYLYFGGYLRSHAGIGLTRLMQSTDLDPAGTRGFYINISPIALRWNVGWLDRLVFELSPYDIQLLAVVPEGIPLVVNNYMTQLTFEWSL